MSDEEEICSRCPPEGLDSQKRCAHCPTIINGNLIQKRGPIYNCLINKSYELCEDCGIEVLVEQANKQNSDNVEMNQTNQNNASPPAPTLLVAAGRDERGNVPNPNCKTCVRKGFVAPAPGLGDVKIHDWTLPTGCPYCYPEGYDEVGHGCWVGPVQCLQLR
jgi:hypothetical protein